MQTNSYLVLLQIEDREKCEYMRFISVRLDCRADFVLCKNQVHQARQINQVGVAVKHLPQEAPETIEILLLGIEEFKINVDDIRLLFQTQESANDLTC